MGATAVVNQKFYYAKLQLEAAEFLPDEPSAQLRLSKQATHLEACLFHLTGAYHALLLELAESHFLDGRSLKNARALCKCLQEKEITNVLVEHLIELEQDGWLADCIGLTDKLLYGETIGKLQSDRTAGRSTPINICSDSADADFPLSPQLCHAWLNNLQQLVIDARENGVEW